MLIDILLAFISDTIQSEFERLGSGGLYCFQQHKHNVLEQKSTIMDQFCYCYLFWPKEYSAITVIHSAARQTSSQIHGVDRFFSYFLDASATVCYEKLFSYSTCPIVLFTIITASSWLSICLKQSSLDLYFFTLS